jgi:cyclic pyranopterin phosphate synthase
MVSIAEKATTQRRATAECWITMSRETLARLSSDDSPKGDVLSTARLAGIMATKRTSDLIPLCHPLALQHVEVDFESDDSAGTVRITCTVEVEAKTGVEMEAMVGANVAALTIYDMLKSLERGMTIGPCRLLHKSGGRSGPFDAKPEGKP